MNANTSNSRPGRILLVALFLTLVFCASANAQTLQLGDPRPPDLGDMAWSTRRAQMLLKSRDQMLHDTTGQTLRSNESVIEHTRASLLLLAAGLLSPPDDAPPLVAARSINTGHILADALELINVDLPSPSNADARSIDDLRVLTAVLNSADARLLETLRQCKSPDELTMQLEHCLSPLMDALVAPGAPDDLELASAIARVESLWSALPADRALPAAMRAVPERLRQLADHPSGREQAILCADRAAELIEHVHRIENTAWLTTAWRVNSDRWLIEGLLTSDDDETPPTLDRAWSCIEQVNAALDAIDAAQQERDASLRLAAYRRATQSAVSDPDPISARRRLSELLALLDRVAQLRTLPDLPRRPSIRRVARMIDDQIRTCEQQSIQTLALRAVPRTLDGDPDFCTLVYSHKTALQTLNDLAQVETLIRALPIDSPRLAASLWKTFLEETDRAVEPRLLRAYQLDLRNFVTSARCIIDFEKPADLPLSITPPDAQTSWTTVLTQRHERLKTQWLTARQAGDSTARPDRELVALDVLGDMIQTVERLEQRRAINRRTSLLVPPLNLPADIVERATLTLATALQQALTRVSDPRIELAPIVADIRSQAGVALIIDRFWSLSSSDTPLDAASLLADLCNTHPAAPVSADLTDRWCVTLREAASVSNRIPPGQQQRLREFLTFHTQRMLDAIEP